MKRSIIPSWKLSTVRGSNRPFQNKRWRDASLTHSVNPPRFGCRSDTLLDNLSRESARFPVVILLGYGHQFTFYVRSVSHRLCEILSAAGFSCCGFVCKMAGSNPTPTIKQFDGKNFGNWEFRVRLVLEQNSVLDAIDCEMPVVNEGIPGSKKALEDWMRMDVKARGIIVDRVDDSILVMVKDKPTAKDMIESLKKTYLKTGMVSRIQIQKRWRRMEFKGDKPLHEIFVEFGNVCSDLRVAGGKVDDAEIIIQLLVAMPEEYDNVVSAIDIAFNDGIEGKLSSSITLDYVKNRLLAEEDRLRRRGGHDDLEEAGPTQYTQPNELMDDVYGSKLTIFGKPKHMAGSNEFLRKGKKYGQR
ncbi:hypothetical protein GE061_019178 [Apolygus lucorum]|uniref:Uncharacterized protein n=1 Tax=Apolygus lucorum TaxID=248454 RepID=A0A8S9X9L3_APOLU|nr:hypothetical protein GE061_019178 [Apolygus lucorum]